SSTDVAGVRRLFDGARASLFATDPPYLIDYTGADRPNGSGKDWTATYHEVEIPDALAFYRAALDRKSTRLNSSHVSISYAVFCPRPPRSTLCPYTTLFRSAAAPMWPVSAVSSMERARPSSRRIPPISSITPAPIAPMAVARIGPRPTTRSRFPMLSRSIAPP